MPEDKEDYQHDRGKTCVLHHKQHEPASDSSGVHLRNRVVPPTAANLSLKQGPQVQHHGGV